MNTEERIAQLEQTVDMLVAANNDQERVIAEMITKRFDNVYGRDEQLGENLKIFLTRYDERFDTLMVRSEEIEELLEEMLCQE